MTDENRRIAPYSLPNYCCGKMTLSNIVHALGLFDVVVWLLVTFVLAYFLGSAVHEQNELQRSCGEINKTEVAKQPIDRNDNSSKCSTTTESAPPSLNNDTTVSPRNNDTTTVSPGNNVIPVSSGNNNDTSSSPGKNDTSSSPGKNDTSSSPGKNDTSSSPGNNEPLVSADTTSNGSIPTQNSNPPSTGDKVNSQSAGSSTQIPASNANLTNNSEKTEPQRVRRETIIEGKGALDSTPPFNTGKAAGEKLPTPDRVESKAANNSSNAPKTKEEPTTSKPSGSSNPTNHSKTPTEAGGVSCVSLENSQSVKKIAFTSVWIVVAVSHIIIGRCLFKVSEQVRSRKVRVWIVICVLQTLVDVIMFASSLAELLETTLVAVFLAMYLVHRLYFFWGLVSFYWMLP